MNYYSTITIYSNSSNNSFALSKEKNFALDDIETYLSTFPSVITSAIYQYIPYQFNTQIKVVINQENAFPANPLNNLKYLKIVLTAQEETTTLYYFINSYTWKSSNTLQLDISLDVLNSFKYGADYILSPRTLVTRQHKDRFIANDGELYNVVVISKTWTTAQLEQLSVLQNSGVMLYFESQDHQYNYDVFIREITENSILLSKYDNSTFSSQELGYYISGTLYSSVDTSNFVVITNTSGAISSTYQSKNIVRSIDFLSEGISPVLYGQNNGDVTSSIFDDDFYLIYRNQNDPTTSGTNPINIYICSNSQMKVKESGLTTESVDVSSFPVNQYAYFVYGEFVDKGYLNTNGRTIIPCEGFRTPYGGIYDSTFYAQVYSKSPIIIYQLFNNGSMLEVTSLYLAPSRVEGYGPPFRTEIFKYEEYDELFYISSSQTMFYGSSAFPSVIGSNADIQNFFAGLSTTNQTFPSGQSGTIASIDQIDRTDPQIVKIIKMPYAPINLTSEDNYYNLDSRFVIASVEQGASSFNLIQLNNLSSPLSSTIVTNIKSPLSIFPMVNFSPVAQSRNIIFESKLYHSEFYQPKFIYDSFEFTYQLERVSPLDWNENPSITFYVTNTANSRFLFVFNDYVAQDGLLSQAYCNVLTIERNNEITLYSNSYLDYLRNGYNYDVKAKNISMASNWVQFASQLVGSGISRATGNMFGLATFGTQTIASLTSAISNQLSLENELERKVTNAKNTTTSVAGSDTVDLMSVYTHNRLKLTTWQISPIMKQLLFNLFYYFGYNDNTFEVPNVHTRQYFNYIKADIVIASCNNFDDAIKEELIKKFSEGITFFHLVNGTYNIEQTLENWEVSLLNEN